MKGKTMFMQNWFEFPLCLPQNTPCLPRHSEQVALSFPLHLQLGKLLT
jgi:hypothetical protein